MVLWRVSRLARDLLIQRRISAIFFGRNENVHFHSLTNCVQQPRLYGFKVVPSVLNGQCLGLSSTASPQAGEKETPQSSTESEEKGDGERPADSHQQKESAHPEKAEGSEFDTELSKDDLFKLLREKEGHLLAKQSEISAMKDKLLRSLAEMENVKERSRRESDNAKKFAIQDFAKKLLDVADNLSRAASATKESFSKIGIPEEDTTGAVQQLKTLLEGVEMTEKQLIEVFKKNGLERYNPVDKEFDPNQHNAVFQVPTASKAEGLVAVVLKAGYTLHDRVIRPAEVGVTVALNMEESESSNK